MSLVAIPSSFLESRHILLDCDGVLLDYLGGFRPFCERQGIHPDGPAPLNWDMSAWLGVDGAELGNLIAEFNEENEDFSQLQPFGHAKDGIRLLKDAGWSMSIVTSATTTPERQQMRLDNLARHFGKDTFQEVVFLGVAANKEAVLSSYAPTLWVEDNYKNALAGFKSGHQPVMLNHPYNETEREASHEQVFWCDGLDQVAAAVLKHDNARELSPSMS